jgi:hypothetical protein
VEYKAPTLAIGVYYIRKLLIVIDLIYPRLNYIYKRMIFSGREIKDVL